MHAVLDTKPGSIYNDEISSLYHFPNRYKKILEKCVGDWVVFREPRDDGGRMAYIAYGRIVGITQDTEKSNHYYAHITQFEDFDNPVPWRLEGVYWEQALRDTETPKVGIYMRGRSVRELQVDDFEAIMSHGASSYFSASARRSIDSDLHIKDPAEDLFEHENETVQVREIIATLTNKKKRDRRFRDRVLCAYSNRCAFTASRLSIQRGILVCMPHTYYLSKEMGQIEFQMVWP